MRTIEEIKKYIQDNKICVVTNSKCKYGTQFLASIKTYISYLPIHNFWIIPGDDIGYEQDFYGYYAFLKMIDELGNNPYYDYVIYLDDDCFVKNMSLLIDEFDKFKESDCCLAGIPDGGVLCHRNHSAIFVNTFLSFWNIKLLRENLITYKEIITNIIEHANPDLCYDFYKNYIQKTNMPLYEELKKRSALFIKNIESIRESVFGDIEVPYCQTVLLDSNNEIEEMQIPYTIDDEANNNFEPYYLLEQVAVLATKKPIYYIAALDLYDITNETTMDNTGLTSVVINMDTKEHILYHTWFSRKYTKWPKTQMELDHTKRINTIIKNI